jgi:hypothetical protein
MSIEQPETLPAVLPPSRLDEFARLGTWLALSESKSETEKAKGAAAALRLYYANELGLTALAAAELSVISGKLVVSARLLRGLAGRAGYHVIRTASTSEACTARLVAGDGTILGETTFTLKDALAAGLVRDRSAWKTHPARMLWARASANVVYDFIPEVALGLITADEADEISQAPPAWTEDESEWEDEATILAQAETIPLEDPDDD